MNMKAKSQCQFASCKNTKGEILERKQNTVFGVGEVR